jgi:pimeloyl-ACP methyl ester carboxylesterase
MTQAQTNGLITSHGGQEVYLHTTGPVTGEPILLLHGGNIDHAMMSWGMTAKALANAGFRVYAPDFPGYGKSPAPQTRFTLELATQVIETLVEKLGLKDFCIAGISMGGGVGLGYTLRHRERVNRLVLVGAYGLQDKAPYHRLSSVLVRIPGLNTLTRWMLTTSPRMLRESLKSIVRNPQALTDELVQEVMDALKHSQSIEVWSQFQRDEIRWSDVKTCFMSHLHEITCPVLIVHGSHDIGVPLRFAQEAARRIPNAQLEVFENAGHWTQRDQPERFNQLLLSFLKKGIA